jgi:hypothetical protein
MNKLDQWTVLTADIVDSKLTGMTQKELIKKLDVISKDLGEKYTSISSPFNLSRGDEIQALLRTSGDLPKIIRRFRFLLQPISVRIGIGFGNVAFARFEKKDKKNIKNSWTESGTAFFNSRNCMDQFVKDKTHLTLFESGDSVVDKTFTSFYALIDMIESDWTDKQWKVANLYEEKDSFDQISMITKTTRQNVEQIFHRANFYIILEAESGISTLIEHWINTDAS